MTQPDITDADRALFRKLEQFVHQSYAGPFLDDEAIEVIAEHRSRSVGDAPSKEWCMKMAALEDGQEIGAGILHPEAGGPPYASDNWEIQGYKSPAEEIDDMANVGRSLIEHIAAVTCEGGVMHGWSPADDPAEIVTDMANRLEDPASPKTNDSVDAVREAVAELQLAAFLAGRGSITEKGDGPRNCKPAPSMEDFRRMALAALQTQPAGEGS